LSRALADAGGAPIAVAVINLDRFRSPPSTNIWEYSVGDAVLIKIASASGGGAGTVESRWLDSLRTNSPPSLQLRNAAKPAGLGKPRLVMALADPVFVEDAAHRQSPRPWD